MLFRSTHLFWPQERWRHAKGMLEYELDQLSTHFTQSVLVREPGRTAHRLAQSTYDLVFIKSGLRDRTRDPSAHARAQAADAKGIKRFVGSVYVHLETYALTASYVLLTFLVRLWVLCLTLPLFATAAFVGLIDGLVRRDLRRFTAGPESGFIYHRAKASIVPLSVLPWVTYLAMPVSVHPLLILLPSALLLSLAVNLTAGKIGRAHV